MVVVPLLNAAAGPPSSGSDMKWPVTFVISPDKAIVSNNRLFTEGDTITFFFDASESCLFMNGEVWRSWKRPHSARIHQAGWGDTLRARFEADTLGSKEERLHRAFASMDTSVLDPTFKSEVGGNEVTVRFKGKDEFVTFIMESLKEDYRHSSEVEVRGLMTEMERSGPYVEVHDPSAGHIRGGKGALELLEVFHRARLGMVTKEDLATARRHYVLEAVEAIQAQNSH